ncbi:hypothetical protein CFIMG_006173RA [Ceratocystis fimbriata CBS 114723]|uniref:Peptidase A1 domain-containing protein n=1 Tax=Ceratocystis fimbriata CBS 114723 TaxID=1035309 RepID=A0A2C5WVF9_9PEZI|nr:hypothetical protein CFIMG_006173RA [Ceratocystis fimbriata CBS 114723]
MRYILPLILASAVSTASADESDLNMAPRSLSGSSWLGIDGNWSATSFRAAGQEVSLFVSTTLSEHWLVDKGGCITNDPLCIKDRGGTVNYTSSRDWKTLGHWSLGLSYLGVAANAEYGTGIFGATDDLTGDKLDMKDALVGIYNTTEFYVGLFGVGVVRGKFGTESIDAPFYEMVEDEGWFPSYSYGYTAGAYYKNMPSSLTLGGYDASRLPTQPSNIDFTLSRDTMIPRVLVRGIQVSTNNSAMPSNWESKPQILSNFTNSFQAIIDSSTPYLWLPEPVIEDFVSAMNLTYNRTLDAYVITNEQMAALKQDDGFEFTFTLSSYDNNNSFGTPLSVDGVVNVTLSGAAFAHVLQYPYKDQAINFGDHDVPYFPIKKARDDNFILGRTFLQEVYLLTRYDSASFQLHQAAFPSDPIKNRNIQPITQPLNSLYPDPDSDQSDEKKGGLSKAALSGIIAGGGSAIAFIGMGIWWFLQRRKGNKAQVREIEAARSLAYNDYKLPNTPNSTFSNTGDHSVHGAGTYRQSQMLGVPAFEVVEVPTSPAFAEVGAEQGHQVFELPCNQITGPVELDSESQIFTPQESEFGDFSGRSVTPYEFARRKIDLQLQGPVPPYSPGDYKPNSSEKVAMLQVEYLPDSPGFIPRPFPSPLTPGLNSDWDAQSDAPVSSMASSPTGSRFAPSIRRCPNGTISSAGSRESVSHTSISRASSLRIVQTSSSENSQFSGQESAPGVSQPAPAFFSRPATLSILAKRERSRHMSASTLGSNFTDTEDEMAQVSQRLALSIRPTPHNWDASERAMGSPHSQRSQNSQRSQSSQNRIDATNDLVHVPQVAERRYSWEENRI